MLSDFSTRYLCRWNEILGDINAFHEFVGDKLFEDFYLIFGELSKISGREWDFWLYEARAEIYRGKNPYDVLSHYDIMLQDLIMEDKKYGKSYGRSRKDAGR